jgi:trans-aconitate methyltransferase
VSVRTFRAEPLLEIIKWLAADLEIRVLDPDRGRGHYAGELVDVDGEPHVHRPWRVWVDVAERLGLRMCTPRVASPYVELRFERLDREARWRGDYTALPAKLEDPAFAIDLQAALARVALKPGARVLDLGCNTGELFVVLGDAAITGVDRSAAALAIARQRWPNATLIEADVTALPPLPRFDLVLSVGLLQSGALDDRALVRTVVQDLLAPQGAVIFGWPNCRYIDGEVEYGARMVNFTEPELGLVIKDIAFYRKYLQQHHRQVFVTGKHYLLVTAVASASPP